MEGLESEEKNLKVNAVLDSNPVSGDFNVNLLNRSPRARLSDSFRATQNQIQM